MPDGKEERQSAVSYYKDGGGRYRIMLGKVQLVFTDEKDVEVRVKETPTVDARWAKIEQSAVPASTLTRVVNVARSLIEDADSEV